ncbi:MAG TPA: YihY/virulence factor BrkB family protein [Planctomycetota bacterium]|nr:YihY/virulence factor BrkB family protein [Planctomycetota bacterium]
MMRAPDPGSRQGGAVASRSPSRRRHAWQLLRDFAADFWDDEPFQLAAATSYYTLLSLAPLLLIVVGVGSLVFERDAVEGRIVDQVRYLVGEQGASTLQTVLASTPPEQSRLSLGVGLLVLLIGASTVFQQLSAALNKIWGVQPDKEKSSWKSFVRKRILSFAMVIAIGFLLLVSLVLSAGLSAAGGWIGGGDPEAQGWQVVNALTSFVVVTLLFAMMFKFLPDAKISWRHTWVGAALTAVLFTVGKQLIGVYLGRASIGSSFGAAGSIVVFTVWIYYASLLVFLGAKITRVTAKLAGERVVPEDFAHRERT